MQGFGALLEGLANEDGADLAGPIGLAWGA